jgi:hypothetical protein
MVGSCGRMSGAAHDGTNVRCPPIGCPALRSRLRTLMSKMPFGQDTSVWAIMFNRQKPAILKPPSAPELDFECAKRLAVGLSPGFHVRVPYDIGEAQAKGGMSCGSGKQL